MVQAEGFFRKYEIKYFFIYCMERPNKRNKYGVKAKIGTFYFGFDLFNHELFCCGKKWTYGIINPLYRYTRREAEVAGQAERKNDSRENSRPWPLANL